MDNRPIGIFDSGLGGLTTLKRITELLPGESIIYLGDTGRIPYGSRSKETILKYTSQDANFLVEFDIKAMVVACNTACSVAYEMLEKAYDMPVYEVVSAPAKAAVEQTINKKVGVIGTTATIRSGAYESALRINSPDLTVYSMACPLFVPLVEEGWITPVDKAALIIAERYLEKLREFKIDTLILGCTHYPLLREVISKVIGPGVNIIDSGSETAKLVAADLQNREMLAASETGGKIKYFVTDSVEGFSKLASRYLESDVYGMVEQITLE